MRCPGTQRALFFNFWKTDLEINLGILVRQNFLSKRLAAVQGEMERKWSTKCIKKIMYIKLIRCQRREKNGSS